MSGISGIFTTAACAASSGFLMGFLAQAASACSVPVKLVLYSLDMGWIGA